MFLLMKTGLSSGSLDPGIDKLMRPELFRRKGLSRHLRLTRSLCHCRYKCVRGEVVVVEPEYLFHVTRNELELSIRLQAVVRGVATKQLDILAPGWKIEGVGPPGVVDSAAVSESSGVVTVPFLKPIAGEVVVELQCSRQLDPASEEVQWTTPVPRADLVGPASVGITSENDIELVPDTERIVGMSRQVLSQLNSPSVDLSRMSYRVQADKATFVATRRILDQQIDASITARKWMSICGRWLCSRQPV